MESKYILRNFTEEDFSREVEQCKQQLVKLGYKGVLVKQYVLVLSTKMCTTMGLCTYLKGWSKFELKLNKAFADTVEDYNALKDVIMHEVCHTIRGCNNHTGKWLELVHRVNEEYGYHIQRQASQSMNYTKYKEEHGLGKYRYCIRCKVCNNSYEYQNRTELIRQIEEGKQPTYFCPCCESMNFELEVL